MYLRKRMNELESECGKLLGREVYVKAVDGRVKRSVVRNVAFYNISKWGIYKDKDKLGNIFLSDPDFSGFIDKNKLGRSCFATFEEALKGEEREDTINLKVEVFGLKGYIESFVNKKVWVITSVGDIEECLIDRVYICSSGHEFGFRDNEGVFVEAKCFDEDGIEDGGHR